MSIIEIIRNMVEKAQRENRNNGVMAVLTCCVNLLWQCFAEIIGFISKFAIVYAAISGDAFCDSARKVTTILQNNYLSTFAVWWLPSMILRTTAFIVTVVFGVVFDILSLELLRRRIARRREFRPRPVLLPHLSDYFELLFDRFIGRRRRRVLMLRHR